MVDAVGLAVPVPGGGGLCASLALKSTGKFAGAFLGAWSKFVTSQDGEARDEALIKARATLQKSVVKAETKAGCTGSGQFEAARVAVEDTLASITACIGSAATCVEAEEEAEAGETVSTDPTDAGPTAEVPLTSSVQTPNAGTVVLRITDTSPEPPMGYEVLGLQVEVTAPDATAAAPLVLRFVLDAGLLPPDPNTVDLTRNGVVIADCVGAPGVADPDPCLQSRTILGSGDLELVALSSHASLWFPVFPSAAPPCPGTMVWEQRADTASTAQASESDIGWAGLTHDIDPVDGARLGFTLDCQSSTQPNCGVCDVTGFDPAQTTCRCANNTRTSCDEPNAADADDCGGAVCQCYTAPPTPVVSLGTPTCLVRRATGNPGGTWDPALGQGDVEVADSTLIYLGIDVIQPCPVCTGDTTANDGVRGGTCSGGASAGLTCDASGSDPSYPAGGGWTSYDCMPVVGNNISGLGMRMTRTETTGTATLNSGVACSAPYGSELCPCAVCSGNNNVACSSDAECAAVSAGTCTSNGSGVSRRPNNCSGLSCVAGSDDEGTCPPSDDVAVCDGILEEDGRATIACGTNTDCDDFSSGYGVPFGTCTGSQPRSCFLSTIQATGVADSQHPRTVSALCVGPIGNGSVNSASGLPGPVRMRTDWEVTYLQ